MQEGIFFDNESVGSIYFDLTAEVEVLLAIFRFWGSLKTPQNGGKSGLVTNLRYFGPQMDKERFMAYQGGAHCIHEGFMLYTEWYRVPQKGYK